MVFGFFRKITSLVLSGICVKWKFLRFNNILRKLHAWEKSCSQVIAKNGSRPVRFQYSLIVNISLIDFYLTLIFGMYMAWMKETRLTNSFSENSHLGKWTILGPKILITLVPLEEFFKKFAQWKGLIGRWKWY